MSAALIWFIVVAVPCAVVVALRAAKNTGAKPKD
jgi:hypothetical protein